ncbi:hypothetical protein Poli38472_004504 [Pythium oligandrum]|uniref:Uncharacterized protein n=1 Tax=Pythium oligandrum TaxID=41045 RepID=A0A8K1CAW5_PYTOL|nr:hypothetical protein Poli38472_004504 [Pythium oligandrum]|eukprot:TMW59435.1 hypothetical protein Poli38472_004504 [Pythium oligandrum]
MPATAVSLRKKALSVRRIFLFILNVASTALTLLTGLRENPVITTVGGRYDAIRSRLRDGLLSYDIVRDDVVKVDKLPDLVEAGDSYRFISAPRRSPDNLASDRSTCRRVNSMNVTVMTVNFDDFWGYGPRRTQVFLFSISAKHCGVLNLKPEWVDSCIKGHQDNATQCHEYILNNFDALSKRRVIQAGVEKDFGEIGVPFLKCMGRPERSFHFNTDLMVQHSFWAGGSFHIEIQTSDCLAKPLIRDADWLWGLFQVEQVDQAADVLLALPQTGWFAEIVTFLYGIVSISIIIMGIIAAFMQSRAVTYLPASLRSTREHKIAKVLAPFMPITTLLAENENSIITFKGSIITASDVWMNHWLFILMSVLDAVVNIRLTYVVMSMGTWMLGKKINFENFIFLCSALTRLTWLMCFVHTSIRLFLKFILRSLRTMKVIKSTLRERLEWYVDATALFMSYKIYNLLLCLMLYMMLKYHKATTFMVRQKVDKIGNYGGTVGISQFWHNEIMCDYTVILAMLTASGLALSTILLLSKYRYIANNGAIRLLQQRYVIVGWDALTAAQILGMDPYDAELVDKDVALTNCSIGSLLQMLSMSGPSGWVKLAGDYLFVDGGFSKGPILFRYPVKRAMTMGLCQGNPRFSVYQKEGVSVGTEHSSAITAHRMTNMSVRAKNVDQERTNTIEMDKASLFERRLRICTEGYVGRTLLVDVAEPGSITKNMDTGRREYAVRDALSFMTILDIKPLLNNEKKLHIQ